jgi:hypothetical protein
LLQNTTYTPLTMTSDSTGTAIQPDAPVLETPDDQIIYGTSFVVLVNNPLCVTPFNLSLINDYIVARPARVLVLVRAKSNQR